MSEDKDNHPLHAAINVKLAEIAVASPTPPSWYEDWLRLSAESTDTERLAIYRAVRDAGSVPEDAGFFLVAWLLDVMTDARAGVVVDRCWKFQKWASGRRPLRLSDRLLAVDTRVWLMSTP